LLGELLVTDVVALLDVKFERYSYYFISVPTIKNILSLLVEFA
jgi:hypothetical protein